MSRQVTDKEKAREWIAEFFSSNPGASQHQCLKAMNNQRFAPFPHLVTEVHQAALQRRMQSMLVSPAKPDTAGGPRPVVPAHEEEPMSPPAVPNESEDLKRAAKALLEVMRKHNISSCILTCSDGEPKPRAEWEVEYRARGTGGVDL